MPINILRMEQLDENIQQPELYSDSEANGQETRTEPINVLKMVNNKQEPVVEVPIEDSREPINVMAQKQTEAKPEDSFEVKHPNIWAAGKAIADIPKGLDELKERVLSGATLGLSDKAGELGTYLAEKMTGVKIEKSEKVLRPWLETTAELTGMAVPISATGKVIVTPIVKLLSKSKEVKAFHKMIGWGVGGAALGTVENLIKEGELPTPKEVATEGALWAGIEGVLSMAGLTGKFAMGINRLAKAHEIPRKEALKIILNDAKELESPIIQYADDFSKYQAHLKKIGGKGEEAAGNKVLNKTAQEFVDSVSWKINKSLGTDSAQGLKEQLAAEEAEGAIKYASEVEKRERSWLQPKKGVKSEIPKIPKTFAKETKNITLEESQMKAVMAAAKNTGVSIKFQGTQEGFGKIPSTDLYNIMDGPAKGATIAIRDFSPEALTKKIQETIKAFSQPKSELRGVGDILKDINTAVGKKGEVSLKGSALTENQIAAASRIKEDAKKAGLTVKKYMEKAGADPSTISKILLNINTIDRGARIGKVKPPDLTGVSPEARKSVIGKLKVIDEYMGAISTRLGNINPKLKNHVRKFEYKLGSQKASDTESVLPLLKKTKKMSVSDKAALDIARKNSDTSTIQSYVNKYGMQAEENAKRQVLDDLHARAKDAGLEMGYIKDYNPRSVKDYDGLYDYFHGTKDWPMIEKAFAEKEKQLGVLLLNPEQKAQVINEFLKGRNFNVSSRITPGQSKERKIKNIWPEINKFYKDSDSSLVEYIHNVNEAIAIRRFFGGGSDSIGVNILNLEGAPGSKAIDIGKSLGVGRKEEAVLRDIYSARFNEAGTRGGFTTYKNLSYIDTMGSPISAITQIGDLAWSIYKNGLIRTTEAVVKSIAGKSAITPKSLGITRIAQEFSDPSKSSKAVNAVFKMTGLEKIDFIGKEALINSTISKARSMAKSPKRVVKLRKELEPVFEGETDALIRDLAEGKTTENVKLYAFNTLADFQPIALSEMTQKYLTAGNGRIFYMLKTFQLKQFDVFRREAFQKIKQKGTRAEGIKNLVKLASIFAAANASADVIKDLILNRPIDLNDKVTDNILRLFGISKWVTWKAREEGVGSALLKQILPPMKVIDAVTKDITTAGDDKGLESVNSIPVGGKLYYWWFGKGANKSESKRSKASQLK